MSDFPDIALVISPAFCENALPVSPNPLPDICEQNFSDILNILNNVQSEELFIDIPEPPLLPLKDMCLSSNSFKNFKVKKQLEIPDEIISILSNCINLDIEPQIKSDLNSIINKINKFAFLTDDELTSLQTICEDISEKTCDTESFVDNIKNIKNEKVFITNKEQDNKSVISFKEELKLIKNNLYKESPVNNLQDKIDLLTTDFKNSESTETPHLNRFVKNDYTICKQITSYIETSIKEDTQELEIQLYPKELGKIKVNLQSNNKNITALFTVQTEQTKEIFDNELPQLLQQFEKQNIKISEIQIAVLPDFNGDSDKKHKQEQKPKHTSKKVNTAFILMDNDLSLLSKDEQIEIEILILQGTKVNYRI